MGSGDYQSLLLHMEWADTLVWRALLALPALPQEGELRERMHHFHSTQWAYLQLWRGEAVHVPELSTFANLRAVAAWARAFYRELPAFVQALQDATLRRTVEFPWAAELTKRFGKVGPVSLAESILQLALHTAHHRGQVVTRLREQGGEPPLIDFVAWLWMGRPSASWEGVTAA